MRKLAFLYFLMVTGFMVYGQNKFKPTEEYSKHSARALNYYDKKEFLQSGMSYDSLFTKNEGQGYRSDKYNAACSWALAGNSEKAFFYLHKAVVIDKWYDLSHILSDADLTTLHADKRWQPLMDTVKINKTKNEANLNKPLVALLDTIYRLDQDDRKNIDTVQKQYGWQSKQMDSLWNKITVQDAANLKRVKNIIDTYGWLGPEKIGQQGATTLFLIIQHSDSLTQVSYVPKMREAVVKGKAEPSNLALLEDRILTNQGKKQRYGSQVKQNGQTGKNEFFPIEDEANVNKRRASVGLQPLEDYAKFFGIEYILPKAKH